MRQKKILGGKMYIWMVIFDGIRLYGLLTVFWQKFTKILPIYLLLPWALYGLSTTWLKVLIPELKYKNFGAIFWKLWGDKLKKPWFLGIFWAFFCILSSCFCSSAIPGAPKITVQVVWWLEKPFLAMVSKFHTWIQNFMKKPLLLGHLKGMFWSIVV